MNCSEAEEQTVPYILGALDAEETASMDKHLANCEECRDRLRQHDDVVATLAYAAPQLDVPPRVKSLLFARIEAGDSTTSTSGRIGEWARALGDLALGRAARPGLAVASAVLAVVIVGGVWFNSRLNEITEDKETLAAQIETVAENEAEMMERQKAQHELIQQAATPGTTVKTLSATETAVSAGASAFVVIEATGMKGILTAIDMPPLTEGKAYQVWLIKDGQVHNTGAVFTVDSTGYGQTDIVLSAPLGEFDAMVITIESEGGSTGPTGESVLEGDL